jgi:hypothetical protein
LSGRGLCDELITRPEESYRLCCVVVCDLETSRMGIPYIYDISRLRVKMPRCINQDYDHLFFRCFTPESSTAQKPLVTQVNGAQTSFNQFTSKLHVGLFVAILYLFSFICPNFISL